tara:strand:- start:26 stop:409 length:384 start_codon:yes stop_codon:yes gene_type:complete
MGVLTKIDGIPVYSSKLEAENWSKLRGIKGSHTHVVSGVTGYMGGETHAAINAVYKVSSYDSTISRNQQMIQPAQPIQPIQSIQPTQTISQPAAQPVQTPQPIQQPVQQPTYTPPASTPSGGGGGGY